MRPDSSRWDDAGDIPHVLHRAAGDLGLLALGLPQHAGGEGEMIDQLVVSEELLLAGVPSGVLAALFTHAIALPPLVADAREELLRDFVRPTLAGEKICALGITEPATGSDVASLRTRAEHDGDGRVINGSKLVITSGHRADFLPVAARSSAPGH